VQALREALVNMLMHADYFSTSKPRIRIFLDHIEFYNPGGLPKDLNDLRKADISQPRNPLIAKMFRVIKLAETAGYGFDKIFKGWSTYVDDVPIYISRLDYVDLKMTTQKTTMLVDGLVDGLVEKLVENYNLTMNQNNILELMLENKVISIAQLSKKVGISTTAIDNNIARLKELKILRRVGPDKGGYWKVIEKI